MAVVIDGTTGVTAPTFDGAVDGADLTGTVSASLLTGTLPALNGSALTNLPAPTSAQVGAAIAGLAAGAVGTYALLMRQTYSLITAGSTYAGSGLVSMGLQTANASFDTNVAGGTASGAQSGTWLALGGGGSASRYPTSLFLRIS